jgi:hypothetical protein
LEADRQTALALSEQKAEEAKLIKARQEGFQAALALLGETSAGNDSSGKDRELAADPRGGDHRAAAEEQPRRRGHRPKSGANSSRPPARLRPLKAVSSQV